MHSMRKRALSALAASTLICLTACGGNSGSGAAQQQKDTQSDKGLPTVGSAVTYDPNHLVNNGDPISLKYYTWYPDTDGAIPALDRYKEIHPNVQIEVVNVGWDDYFTKLPMLLKGKDGPAIFGVHNSYDEVLQPYLAPYDIDVADLQKDFVGVEGHISDSNTVSYIDAAINTGNVYYNKALWNEAGLTESDIPKTWEQLRDVAVKLTKHDGDTILQCGFNLNGDGGYSALFEGMNYQQNELLFSSDGKTPNFDNEVTKSNLQWMKDLYDKDKVCSPDFGTDADKSFGNGQSAMIYRWGYFEGDLKTKYQNIEYGIFPTPTPTEDEPFAYDRYNGESTIGINKNASAEQQAVAQDIVRFMLADDTYVKAVAQNMNSYPAKKSLENDPDLSAMNIFSLIKPRVDRLIWPGPMPATVENTAKTVAQDVFFNGVSIDEAVKNGQETMQNDLAKSNFQSVENQYKHIDDLK